MSLDILKAHHARRHMRALEFPEFADADGAPLVIHVKAVTPALRAKINRRAGGDPAKGREADPMRLVIESLIALACTADGAPMFPDNAETRKDLDNAVSPDDLATIVAKFWDAGAEGDLGN